MDKQKTLKKKISFEGIGLHSGQSSKIEILPAPINTGIVFIRQDLGGQLIKADFYSIGSTEKFPRRTSVCANGIYIHTVEHLMAAFNLLRVDNAQINIWGEEVPGLDGSAKEFVQKIQEIGLEAQDAPINYLVVKEPIWVEEGQTSIVALPSDCLRMSYALKYDNPLIGSGCVDVVLDGNVQENIFQARTFCLEDEVKSLLDIGLGKGANYENTLVVSKEGVVKNKLRFPDEFVKHKVLDLIGDLYLAGPIKAHIIAVKSGHSLNIKLLEKLRRYKEKTVGAGVGSHTSFVPTTNQLSSEEIMKLLPHRYPFLLVDRIIDMEKLKRAVGIKNVTMNEYFFQGHFPGRPVMPGVLIIEAMAQVGGVLMLSSEENKGKLAYFMAANNAKFRRTVVPGDQLVIEVVAGKVRSKTGTVHAKAFVDEKLAAEAELMFALVD
ncbi:MAG: UDP-3-O-acyl-N-acetylglucosamine deacetylase [Candidatus Omnitrophica bacterium]|jgi:UDP-3-O-[3-hydroxymyristoyl] N-acetylglucosamine deacetylase/3-hydroxyacyl-[acyl-carrier-protein] dehydratase|nr:UDP-3-O-acyl-N-acetylglucosamine deacetylase [Candidatus Omnitrophota bacterium]